MMKKELVITLIKTELIYEVQNKTHLMGMSRNTGENYEQVANMQMSDDDEHMNQILRSFGDAYRDLRTKMSVYLVGDAKVSNNMQEEEEGNFKLELRMPGNFNQAVSDSLASACHRYLVNTALCDWFLITNPEEAKVYAGLAAEAISAVREAMNKRTIPTRIAPKVD